MECEETQRAVCCAAVTRTMPARCVLGGQPVPTAAQRAYDSKNSRIVSSVLSKNTPVSQARAGPWLRLLSERPGRGPRRAWPPLREVRGLALCVMRCQGITVR